MTTTTTRTLTKIYQKGRYCSDNSHGDICPCNICPRDNCHASRSTVYLSCYWSDFDHILKVVLCDYSELVTTVKMTFLQATFVLVTNCQLSRSTRTNVFYLPTFFGTNIFYGPTFLGGSKLFGAQNYLGTKIIYFKSFLKKLHELEKNW